MEDGWCNQLCGGWRKDGVTSYGGGWRMDGVTS